MEVRHYKVVSDNYVDRNAYVVTNGSTLQLSQVGGDASNPGAYVRIIWDRTGTPEIILVTHGDANQDVLGLSFLGDGVKAIEIELINDTDYEVTLGGFWKGREV